MQPHDLDAVFEQANRHLEAGKPEDALRCLAPIEGALLEVDDRIEWTALSAWALTELGRHREALDRLEPLLAEFEESARLLGALGVVFSNMGRLEDACEVLEHAQELDPEDHSLVANLGLVYEKLNQFENALSRYDEALARGGEVDWLLQRRAAVQTELGDDRGAAATIKRYLSLAPDDDAQWINLAILYSDQDDFTSAFACFAEAARVAPDSPLLRLNWGVTAVRAKRVDVAREQLEVLNRIDPGSSRPILLQAFILEEEGGLDAARAEYRRALAACAPGDDAERTYALEMAMDFAARHELLDECDALFAQAYRENACTLELCEPYREVKGEPLDRGSWFSVTIEADYRAGLCEIADTETAEPQGPPTRYQRVFQVVARDRDDALTSIRNVLDQNGETNAVIREFLNEESLENTHSGIYEIERDSLVFRAERTGDDRS